MSVLWSQILDQAFEALGVIRPGESVTSSIQNSGFLVLQQVWASNCIEKTFGTQWYHQTFTLTAGTSVYTVGTGGTLVATADPVQIVGWRSVSGLFESAGPVISFEEFDAKWQNAHAESAVLVKAVAADGSVPSKTIRVAPVPATSPGSLILDYYALMAQPALLSDPSPTAPGYQEFMRNAVAIALYPQYARAGAQSLQALAANRQTALSLITGLNAQIHGLQQAPPPQAG
jgi:hypothetical protein